MFGKLQEAKQKMEEIKLRLDTIGVTGEADNGAVKVYATASRKVQRIELSDELLKSGDKEQIEELITVAVNRAMEQADNVSASEMQAVASGLLPGLGGLGSLFGK